MLRDPCRQTVKQKYLLLHNFLADQLSRQPAEDEPLEPEQRAAEKLFTKHLWDLTEKTRVAMGNHIRKIHDW